MWAEKRVCMHTHTLLILSQLLFASLKTAQKHLLSEKIQISPVLHWRQKSGANLAQSLFYFECYVKVSSFISNPALDSSWQYLHHLFISNLHFCFLWILVMEVWTSCVSYVRAHTHTHFLLPSKFPIIFPLMRFVCHTIT